MATEVDRVNGDRFRLRGGRPAEERVKALEMDLRARFAKVGLADRVALDLIDYIRRGDRGVRTNATGRYVPGLVEIALKQGHVPGSGVRATAGSSSSAAEAAGQATAMESSPSS